MKELIFLPLVFGDLVVGQQLIKKARPLLTEKVSSGERTITSNHHQIGDATGHQVVSSLETTLPFTANNMYFSKNCVCEIIYTIDQKKSDLKIEQYLEIA